MLNTAENARREDRHYGSLLDAADQLHARMDVAEETTLEMLYRDAAKGNAVDVADLFDDANEKLEAVLIIFAKHQKSPLKLFEEIRDLCVPMFSAAADQITRKTFNS